MKKLFFTFTLLTFLVFLCPVFIMANEIVVGVETLKSQVFAEQVFVQGNVEAVKEAKISARLPGLIEKIYVDEGDEVKKDETCLFQLDSLKLQKNLEIRKQELEIAKLSLKEKEIRHKQAKADLEKAKLDIERYRYLLKENSTSKDNFEKIQLKHQTSELTLEHSQAIINLAIEQIQQAELAIKIATKDLADTSVYAPFDGRVVTKLQEPGEMTAPGNPILLLKSTNETEIIAHLPAEYYHRVVINSTRAIINTTAGACFETLVTYKSPVINPLLRTFQIKCRNLPSEHSLIPGELANIKMIMQQRKNLSIPTNAIIQRKNKQMIFISDNSMARIIEIKPGLENDGRTELLDSGLSEGVKIIVSGQHLLSDGQAIKIGGGGK